MTTNTSTPEHQPLYIAPYFVVGDLVTVDNQGPVFRVTTEPVRGRRPVYVIEPVAGGEPVKFPPFRLHRA